MCLDPEKSQVCWDAGAPFPLLLGSSHSSPGLRMPCDLMGMLSKRCWWPSGRFNIAYCQIRLQSVNPLLSPLSFAKQLMHSWSQSISAILKGRQATPPLLASQRNILNYFSKLSRGVRPKAFCRAFFLVVGCVFIWGGGRGDICLFNGFVREFI